TKQALRGLAVQPVVPVVRHHVSLSVRVALRVTPRVTRRSVVVLPLAPPLTVDPSRDSPLAWCLPPSSPESGGGASNSSASLRSPRCAAVRTAPGRFPSTCAALFASSPTT